MSNVFRKYGSLAVGAVFLAAGTRNASSAVDAADTNGTPKPMRSDAFPNLPGKNLTAVLVTYPPGGKSGKHHHAGIVFAFVISGAIGLAGLGPGSSQGDPRVLHGASFVNRFEQVATFSMPSD